MLKPKVFISSRFKLGKVREKVKSVLELSGFEVDLFERDLTPSSRSATYLSDIRDADFVIFIFDEREGTPRPGTSRTGTQEEWYLSRQLGIPSHVYLKREDPKAPFSRKQREFIRQEVVANEVSYFSFQKVSQIVPQIQRSIARMASDISFSRRFRQRVDRKEIISEMVQDEYKTFAVFTKWL